MGFLDRFKAAIGKTESTPLPQAAPATPVDYQRVLDRYYRSMERMERAKSKRAFGEALQIAVETCDSLGEFVDAWRADELQIHGGALPVEWFPIKSIPAIEIICQLAPPRLDSALLDRAEGGLRQRNELNPWLTEIEAARARLALAESVFQVLAEEPGTKQAGLAKALGSDGNDVRSVVYWAEADGRVIRTKAGSTYQLWLPGQQPPADVQGPGGGTAVAGLRPDFTPAAPARRRRVAVQRPLPTPPDAGLVEALTRGRFAAIDFETATFERASACAVAVATVDDGQIRGSGAWLIQPPGNHYEGWNTALHGIGPEDTASEPPFEEVMYEVLEVIGDRPLVAHYAPFDLGVLRSEYLRVGRPWPSLTVACSVVMSRRAWPGLSSYSLPLVADFLNLDPFTHHDPTADAKTCAEILRLVLAVTDADDLDAAARSLGVGLGRLEAESYNPCLARFSGKWEFEQPDAGDLDPEHPFADADVAFTGTLMSMTRREAAQLVVDVGGRFSSSVSGKTEFLVFGEQDFTKFVDGERSTKTKKAEALLAHGHHVQIISEADFLQMLDHPVR